MKKTVGTLLVSILALSTGAVLADGQGAHRPRDPGVNAQQHRQHHRLQQGSRSGELTRNERKQLAQEQRGIRKEERAYKSDGRLTKDERKDLRQDQKQASQNIYNEKHDAEKRQP